MKGRRAAAGGGFFNSKEPFLIMPGKAPLHCPICDKLTDFFTDPLGPFCSSRCRQIDLGKWLGEDYRVSEPLNPEHFAEFENLEGPELDQPPR